MSNKQELPQMAATALASTSLALMAPQYTSRSVLRSTSDWQHLAAVIGQQHDFHIVAPPSRTVLKPIVSPKETKMSDAVKTLPARRLVQIFIADPDENVPLDKALLYSGEQRMTDLSDQELFFEIDISGILKRHNELRVTLTDKSIKSKTVHLEPARIRDLKMTVVTIASF